MINESCHLSSKVEIMVSICWIAPYKYRNRLWFGAVLGISAVSATFFCSFPAFWLDFGVLFGEFLRFQLLFSAFFRLFELGLAGFGVLFGEFLRFQLLFSALFRIFGWVWGAVLGISAVSATFFCSFPDFWLGLGCCFGDFCGFSYFFCFFPAFLAGFWVLFREFMHFQLLFPVLFRLSG